MATVSYIFERIHQFDSSLKFHSISELISKDVRVILSSLIHRFDSSWQLSSADMENDSTFIKAIKKYLHRLDLGHLVSSSHDISPSYPEKLMRLLSAIIDKIDQRYDFQYASNVIDNGSVTTPKQSQKDSTVNNFIQNGSRQLARTPPNQTRINEEHMKIPIHDEDSIFKKSGTLTRTPPKVLRESSQQPKEYVKVLEKQSSPECVVLNAAGITVEPVDKIGIASPPKLLPKKLPIVHVAVDDDINPFVNRRALPRSPTLIRCESSISRTSSEVPSTYSFPATLSSESKLPSPTKPVEVVVPRRPIPAPRRNKVSTDYAKDTLIMSNETSLSSSCSPSSTKRQCISPIGARSNVVEDSPLINDVNVSDQISSTTPVTPVPSVLSLLEAVVPAVYPATVHKDWTVESAIARDRAKLILVKLRQEVTSMGVTINGAELSNESKTLIDAIMGSMQNKDGPVLAKKLNKICRRAELFIGGCSLMKK